MTKVTYSQKQCHLVGSVLFDIHDDHPNIRRADSQQILRSNAHVR